MQAVVRSQEQNVPKAPEVGHGGHGKDDHALDGYRKVVDVAQEGKNAGDDDQEEGGDADTREISAQIGVTDHKSSLQVIKQRGNQRREEQQAGGGHTQ